MLSKSKNCKISRGLCGIFYGRAQDLWKDIPFVEIKTHDGLGNTCGDLQKNQALSVVRKAYNDLMELLSTKRGNNETLHNFVSRFSDAVAKLN